MKNFKTLIALSLLGSVICSCSPSTSSLNKQSSVARVQPQTRSVSEAAARPYAAAEHGVVTRTARPQRSIRPVPAGTSKFRHVRTTSYSCAEKEKGGIYGRKNAIGTTLKYGQVRSAAADWSRFPLGTKFKIVGEPHMYVIDDYGSALVGTDTIDIYKPNISMMNAWGVRHIDIEILEWGCYKSSYSLLSGRKHAAPHCWQMYKNLKPKVGA